MTVHRDGLIFLGYCGLVLLGLAAIVFLFSGYPAVLLTRFLDSCVEKLPQMSKEQRKRQHLLLGKEARAFKIFLSILLFFAACDVFIFSEKYHLPSGWLWPAILTIAGAAVLVIFLGPVSWDDRPNWKKWSFWVSWGVSDVVVLWMTHLLQPRRVGGLIIVGVIGFAAFAWFFGTLRPIDQHKAEPTPSPDRTNLLAGLPLKERIPSKISPPRTKF